MSAKSAPREWSDILREVPLWFHAVVLAVLLVGLAWSLAPPQTPFVSDEGAYILEARLIASGRWTAPGAATGLQEQGQYVGANGAFFSAHPVYPLALAGAHRVLGERGYVGLSAAGGLMAAVLSALAARRIERGLDVVTLWLVGLGSPLFFDSLIAVAHTLAAAAAVGGLSAAITLGRKKGGLAQSVGSGAMLVVAVAAGALLRSEGLLVAGALIAGSLAMACTETSLAKRWLGVAAVTAGTTVAVRLAEGRWIATLFHGRAAVPFVLQGETRASSFIVSQLAASAHNLVSPAPYRPSPQSFVLVAAAIGALLLGLFARRPGSERVAVIAGGVSCASYGIWLLGGARSPVTGLVVAWPIALVGLGCLRWSDAWSKPEIRVTLVTSGAFVLGVAALGTDAVFQWGGRYFSAVIPLVAPVIVLGIKRLSPTVRGSVIGMSMVVTVLVLAVGVDCLRSQHALNAGVGSGIARCAQRAGSSGLPGTDRRPLVVVSATTIPQVAWSRYSDYTWLNSETGDMRVFLRELSVEGARSLVLASGVGLGNADFGGYHVVQVCPAGWARVVALRAD